jgi:hypothetical protein
MIFQQAMDWHRNGSQCVYEFLAERGPGGDSEITLTERLKYFSERKNELNAKCPQIPTFAYRRGKKGIERGEAQYAVDSQPAKPVEIIHKPE